MSIWYYTQHITVICIVSCLQIAKVETVFFSGNGNACSSRPDGKCVKCNGVPECFDLSDEIGCPNTTVKFLPIHLATETCHKRKCLKDFPEPPPLPPFSLCDGKQQTTTRATTSVPVTTTTASPATSPTTPTPVTTKPTTQPTTSTVTYYPTWPPYRPTTTRRSMTTKWWPFFPTTTTTTAPPTWSTTQQIPTTTTNYFMKLFWHCATKFYNYRDISYCAACLIGCDNLRCWLSCFRHLSQTPNSYPVRTAPVTAANSLLNPVSRQFFPTFPPTTRPPVLYTNQMGVQDQSNSNELANQDMAYVFMLRELFQK